MKYKECIDCHLSLVCVGYKFYLAYCSSLKRRILIAAGAKAMDDSVYLPPSTCPRLKKSLDDIQLKCGGGSDANSRPDCGMCKVLMAVLREKIAEEKKRGRKDSARAL